MPAFTVGWTDHRVPFHRAASGGLVPALSWVDPTAVQAVLEVHDTLDRKPGKFETCSTDHRVPFHRAASGNLVMALFVVYPTAVQAVADVHETPFRTPLDGLRNGLGRTAHRLPFQRSTSPPTARHALADEHDTPLSPAPKFAYAIKAAAGAAPRPRSQEGKRIERGVTIATVLEFAAAIILPVIVSRAGHSDWVLPSIAVTIGPLLLWLDYRVDVPRYRPVGWALTVGPVFLVIVLSGTALVATTGIAAGLILLATAFAGFRDLAGVRVIEERANASDSVVPSRVGASA